MKTTTTAPKDNSDRSRFIFLEIASYKRCSRPLCSSQTTTPYHTPHTHPPPKGQSNHAIDAAKKPETNKYRTTTAKTPETHKHRPTQAKSRSTRPCCLRTQQCAKH